MAGSSTSNRIRTRNKIVGIEGKCVLYVMSRDQRVDDNHVLLAAQKDAIDRKLPLGVVFCLKPQAGFRSREQYEWMIMGLREVEAALSQRNIPFILVIGDPLEKIKKCLSYLEPTAVYFDFSPLNSPRRLVDQIAKEGSCEVYEVDTHNVIPVWEASDKIEVGARTLRPKIGRLIERYLIEPEAVQKHPIKWNGPVLSIKDLDEKIQNVLSNLSSNGQSKLDVLYPPGSEAAHVQLKSFILNKLRTYHLDRNDPNIAGQTELSPYIHFGHISSLRVIIEAKMAAEKDATLQEGLDVLIEEMVVRKELSDNFCYYGDDYMTLAAAPSWAQQTLARHTVDDREYLYGYEEFVAAKTHDPAWNAAQCQLLKTGKMHGYMRMYWAKKVLEWSESPEAALENLIKLNDTYSLDGGDPNSYIGILWSVAGLHDRPWKERPIYGTVRSMVYNGLRRKFDISAYEQRWNDNE